MSDNRSYEPCGRHPIEGPPLLDLLQNGGGIKRVILQRAEDNAVVVCLYNEAMSTELFLRFPFEPLDWDRWLSRKGSSHAIAIFRMVDNQATSEVIGYMQVRPLRGALHGEIDANTIRLVYWFNGFELYLFLSKQDLVDFIYDIWPIKQVGQRGIDYE